jgi:hypothetical protein
MNRVIAGKKAKEEGHIFEERFASRYGLSTLGGNKTKVDVKGEFLGKRNLSLKNPSKKHTQVWLPSQKTFSKALSLSSNSRKFVDEFFGGDNYEKYERHRKTYKQIDSSLSKHFLDELNSKSTKLFKCLFTHGYDMTGSVELLGWATEKNNLDSIEFIDLNKFKKDFVKKGKWEFSQTTLHFYIGDKKLLHLQMKGSGKKYSSGYHSPQFHLHGNWMGSWKR